MSAMTFYQTRKRMPPSMATCSICAMRPECIRASALAQVDAKNPGKLRGLIKSMIYRTPPSPEAQARMDAGAAAHKELEIRRDLETNPERVINRIRDRDRFYWSLAVCSVRYGLRGTVDAILNEPSGEGGRRLKLTVIDDKPYISSPYLKQTWAYALMLSDPNCLYTKSIDADGEEVTRQRLYEAVGLDGSVYDNVEVWSTINPYRGKKGSILERPYPPELFSRGSIFEQDYKVFAVLKTKKKILEAYFEPERLAASAQMKFHGRTGEYYLPKSEGRKR